MIVLDENFPESQRLQLKAWHIPVRQIGLDIGAKGISDTAIVTLLIRGRNTTFVTMDYDFYRRELAHPSYCLAVINTGQVEAAVFTRRLQRHQSLNTSAKRVGKVIRVSQAGVVFWQTNRQAESRLSW